jgi:hypothetical protein
MKNLTLIIVIIVAFSFVACKKEAVQTPVATLDSQLTASSPNSTFNGTYTGQFICTQLDTAGQYSSKIAVTFTLTDGLFTSGNNQGIGYVGYGSFKKLNDSLNFNGEESVSLPNGGEGHYALSLFWDSYGITSKGDSLILTKVTHDNIYCYRVKKQ